MMIQFVGVHRGREVLQPREDGIAAVPDRVM